SVANTDTVQTSIEKLQGQVDAAKTSLTGKEDALTAGTTAQYYRGDKTWQTLDKAAVGLSNVDDIQQMPLSYLDTTTTLGADDAKVPSQNAVKTYVDSNLVWSKNVNDVYYNTGKVGVGTTIPIANMHVSGGSAIYNSSAVDAQIGVGATLLIDSTANANNMFSQLVFKQRSTGDNYSRIVSSGGTAPDLRFVTGASDSMIIDNSGNVGIGTTAPTSLLHVKGAVTSETNGYSIFNAKSYSDTESPHFVGYRARGTEAAPTYPLTGDALATFQGRNGIDNQNSGGIVLRASEDQSATNHGTEIRFQTTANTTLPVSDRMIVGHDGNVGIGTMTPASKLEVAGGGIVSSYLDAGRSTTDGAMRFTASTGAVLFDADGNKRIAWNDGQADFAIRSGHYFDGGLPKYQKETGDPDGGAAMLKMLTDGVPGTIELSVAAVGAPAGFVNYNNRIMIQDGTGIVLSTGGGSMQERMRIKTDGLVGIGTSNPQYKLDVSGGDINASGNVRSAGVVLTSDERFKTDIQVIENATEKLKQLVGVSYVWRRDEFPDRHFNDRKQIGVIAQDVEKIFPELVDKDAKGYMSVNYPGLIAPLIQSVKEQDERISELENSHREIASLKEENESLKKEVSDMKEILCEIKPDAKICN
ncbi:endosialidase chaperone, partial [Bacteriovorax sp. BSW11_IV]|uniref:tail fiber domain-containing protein n=1 Tax=Bacteriovorax sp. BSW11_IV TaxID=1353529 RepID=UPI000389E0B9